MSSLSYSQLMPNNNGLQTKPSIRRLDFRRVYCSGSLNPVVRRSTDAAIDALAKPVLVETDLHVKVKAQRERLELR